VDPSTWALKVWGGSVNITEGDEGELKGAIYHHGPVSIAFQVVNGFKDYTTGVYTSDVCKNSTNDVNHAVVAVGFGTCPVTGMDYWIVKNSWGATWGDQGYFKIERGVNMCGVAVCNSFPQDISRVNHKA
jgi:cathepsin H